MTAFVLFVICTLASALGSIVGAGGGVIIKPVLDMIGLLPVSTVSFCSGCTVLGMSLCSLIGSRKGEIRLHLKTSTLLAIGAVCGGIVGKWLFELVRSAAGNENVLGMVQAACLTGVNFFVLLYVCRKDKISSGHVTMPAAVITIGIFLSVISSFLGIGGGPINVAVLFFFFSMEAKEAAKNSLYIIVFSQISNIASAIVTDSVPEFKWIHLGMMILGGIGGALLGNIFSRKMDNKDVESVLKVLVSVIVCLGIYNILKYSMLC